MAVEPLSFVAASGEAPGGAGGAEDADDNALFGSCQHKYEWLRGKVEARSQAYDELLAVLKKVAEVEQRYASELKVLLKRVGPSQQVRAGDKKEPRLGSKRTGAFHSKAGTLRLFLDTVSRPKQ